MTFIQPNKNNGFLNKILIVFVICLVLGTVWLVILYNRVVNLNQSFSRMRSEFQGIQATNAELKEKIFNLLEAGKLESSLGTKLVQDKNPEYLQINSQWSYASQF